MTKLLDNGHTAEYFKTPVKVKEGVYHIGRVYNQYGNFIRNLIHFGAL